MKQRENALQREVCAAIGAERDFLLLPKNSVGRARHVTADGREYFVDYGLGKGSPDLLGILGPSGRLVAFELKVPGERADEHQAKVHAIWSAYGAAVFVVTSVAEARAALDAARSHPEAE